MRKKLFSILLMVVVIKAPAGQFVPQQMPEIGELSFKGSELCKVAENTQNYLSQHTDDKYAVHSGTVFDGNIGLLRVEQTLAFLCQTYREDVRENRPSRLHDKLFLQQNFDLYRWMPDTETAHQIANKSNNKAKQRLLTNIPKDKLFVTKYYTKLLTGSSVKTEQFNQALYQLPYDEVGLSQQQAEQRKNELIRFKYTRQQVMAGELDKNQLAKPLVWLTEAALHDVLLQGTGVLQVDGKTRYFNVHRNNGISYDYSLGKAEQARYWYFAEVNNILGYGKEIDEKIPLMPHVSLAGNVKQLGLGKLFLINFNQGGSGNSRLAILADEGGAFDNNLFQLDLLVDSYYGWTDYYQANKHLPDYAEVWLMLLKNADK